jgi:hypothetical protein
MKNSCEPVDTRKAVRAVQQERGIARVMTTSKCLTPKHFLT